MFRALLAFCCATLLGCQTTQPVPSVQMRVANQTPIDFAKVWVGVGGREHDTVLFEDLPAGATSAYQSIPSAYYGYGKVNVTTTAMERLPRITLLAPDQDGPVLEAGASYTLVYQASGTGEGGRVSFRQDS